jgi:MFS family permease
MTAVPASATTTAPPREASKLGQYSWALFDWANQPFFTVITTFLFSNYFANTLVHDSELARLLTANPGATADQLVAFEAQASAAGQAAWTFTQSASGFLIAVLSPLLGSMADAGGRRKPYILVFQALVALGCLGLWFARPDRPDLIWLVSLSVIVATIGAEFSIVFNNALLPNIVRPERIGWLSGFGWGMGYVGGLIALIIALIIGRPSIFGLGPEAARRCSGSMAPAARSSASSGRPRRSGWRFSSCRCSFHTRRDADRPARLAGGQGRRARPLAYGGAAAALPQSAALPRFVHDLQRRPAAVIALGGVYAGANFGWGLVTTGIFGIIVTVFAAVGAFAGGALDDRIGSKRYRPGRHRRRRGRHPGHPVGQPERHSFRDRGGRAGGRAALVRLGAGTGFHGFRHPARCLHGADAGGQPHHDGPAGPAGDERRVLRPVRPLRAGDRLPLPAPDRPGDHRHRQPARRASGRAGLPGGRLPAAVGCPRGACQQDRMSLHNHWGARPAIRNPPANRRRRP